MKIRRRSYLCFFNNMQQSPKITIIGLGYVGLPLAVAFAEHYQVVGFDINAQRLQELRNHQDKTLEVSHDALKHCMVPSESELSEDPEEDPLRDDMSRIHHVALKEQMMQNLTLHANTI